MKKYVKITVLVVLLCNFCYVNSWPPSLANCDNTCFLNASVQVLYNIRPLTDLLLKESTPYSQETVQYYYTEMIRKFEAKKGGTQAFPFSCDGKVADSGDPDITLEMLDKNAYKVLGRQECSQQDATDFIFAFLSKLIEESSDNIIKAQLRSTFEFTQPSELVCPAIPNLSLPKYESTTREDHLYLFLPAQNEIGSNLTTLGNCFKNYFAKEDIENVKDNLGRERPMCTKQLILSSSPEILMVGLKRYTKDLQRLSHSIVIPAELNVADFVKNGKSDASTHQYELIGVVVQGGGFEGGHYWAYVKDEKDQWYKCDDSSITSVSFESFKGDRDRSYFVIYQKLSSEEVAKRAAARKQEEARRKQQEQVKELETELYQLKVTLKNLEHSIGKVQPSQ